MPKTADKQKPETSLSPPEIAASESPATPADVSPDAPAQPDPTASEDQRSSSDPRENPDYVEPVAPVKVALAPDFAADGDVYISIPELPADLRLSEDDDRLQISKEPIEVPPAVAAQLVESPAVEAVE